MFIEGLFHRFVEIEFVFGPDFRDGRRRRSLGEQGSREEESKNEKMFFHQSAFGLMKPEVVLDSSVPGPSS